MKINNQEVIGEFFAYDECHKIYILENENNINEAKAIGYSILPIEKIKDCYFSSCVLRFIQNWDLTKVYASQWDDDAAEFEE